ncbi:MAG: acetoacetyl-CoA reductase [Gammaproteobacteria bacterium]|nr:acetoacetyl-CoA reductase [Gammaproteobacteria bacterium]MDJ0871451.1 acetoacetyl-CoA reductase [Gammaproteobacteria bacterium]
MTGKVALVTGGTGGIGSAICEVLAEEGCKVATNYRSEEKLASLTDRMKDKGLGIAGFRCDITNDGECETLAQQVEEALGAVDILVNNAGITRDTTFRKMTGDKWRAVIDTNLNSAYNVTRPLIEGMMARGYGRIINISSINGQKGQIGQTNYSAAKAGLHGFTMALAQEVARKGVTVNTVSPGYVATDMVMAVPENIRNAIIAQIPVGRLGEPAEIARLIAYLASDSAAFVTGADISINGGQHMG